MESINLAQLLPRQADRLGDRPALRFERHGVYHDISWRRYLAKSEAIAAALVGVGVRPGDRVALVGENSVDWLAADVGILMAGAVTVSPHAPLTARQIHYQLHDAEAVWAFASNAAQLAKLRSIRAELPALRGIVVFDPALVPLAPVLGGEGLAVRGASQAESQAGRLSYDVEQASRLLPSGPGKVPLYDRHHIVAFATGKPSEAFGERYRVFDEERQIARLPADPYRFLDRITAVSGEPWVMVAGGTVDAEVDVLPDAWYFESERSGVMPFAVLLEAALQVCGWMSSYLGSALTSEKRLHYRNLGGTATLHRPVTPTSGTLRTHVETTRVSSSGGMIIQEFTFDLHDDAGRVYQGSTMFGFFSPEALAQQLGVRDATLYAPTADELSRSRAFAFPRESPMPDDTLCMMDAVEVFIPDGGPAKLGFIQGTKSVRADEWFFRAHFYQDPVWPGSLGLEAMLQLMKVVAVERWGHEEKFICNVGTHRWQYRGQVLPTNTRVTVQASVTAIDDARRRVTAEGYLIVDGLVIYRMSDFVVELVR